MDGRILGEWEPTGFVLGASQFSRGSKFSKEKPFLLGGSQFSRGSKFYKEKTLF
jgi:hypothetical protein